MRNITVRLPIVLGVACAALAGCGKSGSSPDSDGGGNVGTPGSVTVSVLDPSGNGMPAAGIQVVFINPAGDVAKSAVTDASGKLDAVVYPGASVTTVTSTPSSFQMRTTLGLVPGESIVIGTQTPSTARAGSFTVTWPAAPNAMSYSVYSPCGLAGSTAAQTLTFDIADNCKSDTMELLVVALDTAGNPLLFNDRADIAFSDGGSAAMADSWSSAVNINAAYANLSSVAAIESTRRFASDNGFGTTQSTPATGLTGAHINLSGPAGNTVWIESALTGAYGGTQTVRQKVAGDALSYQLDVAANQLAWLDKPVQDASGRFLISRSTGTTSSQQADLLELDISWLRNPIFYTWTVFGPDAPTVELPRLPASISPGLNPSTTDGATALATLYDTDSTASYDAVRPNVAAAISEATAEPHGQTTITRTSVSSSRAIVGVGW